MTPPFTQMTDLLPRLAEAVAPLLDRPFAIFGHSMGAIVGFEFARWLRRNLRMLPDHLFMSGRRAPQFRSLKPLLFEKSDEDFVKSIADLKGMPPEVLQDRELLELLLPTLRADCQLSETYRYTEEEPLACPITAFGGSEDEEIEDGRLEGWGRHTSASFSAYVLEGNHFFLHPRETELLSYIRDELRSTLQRQDHRGHRSPQT
jgi:medium-chain acyl-[acyl-carrier-protein] hydrolase